jgi:LysM repeat protein
MANGQLLSARKILNAALQSKSLSPADTKIAKQLISEANQSIVFSPTRYADDPYGGTYTVQKGDTFARIAARNDVTADFLMNINGITDARKLRVGATLKIVHGPFHAIVDKSDFTMDIYLGYPGEPSSLYVTTYRVGLGSDDSTPTGTWLVEPQKKLKNPTYYSPRGEGIIEADDPKNPLGEYWLGLVGMEGHAVGKESYGIHGTIEPDSIGKQASMGCIRMLNEDVKQVYELLVEGKSTVIVQE